MPFKCMVNFSQNADNTPVETRLNVTVYKQDQTLALHHTYRLGIIFPRRRLFTMIPKAWGVTLKTRPVFPW